MSEEKETSEPSFGYVALATLLTGLFSGLCLMLLWNTAVGHIFGLKDLNFAEAYCLWVFCRVIFDSKFAGNMGNITLYPKKVMIKFNDKKYGSEEKES